MQPDWQQYLNLKHGKDYQWKNFAKGSSNTLYRGVCGHDNLVVRVNASAELTPGVDRAREASLLEIITGNTWSPNIIENQPECGWCAMQCYVPFTEEVLSKQQKLQLIKAMTDLQLIDIENLESPQALAIQYETLWDTLYLPEAKRQNNFQALVWIAKIKRLLKTLPDVPFCFVHHDLHIGNLAVNITTSPETLVLLDWEYGAIGNPWIDAAALKSLLGILDEDIATLPAFNKLSKASFEKGLAQAIELYNTIGNIWHWLRAQNNT
ncbi:phosphotransferase family protein [Leucothrix arctica]|uniref:Aminoglycoside phosphotransferase domain-containing protein n=1 Tax=Leucothrix arctica TaxID=1481894 RepID=A0A317CPL9_9GAMM|nr:phosphotransferase [Leucothrix arctica]PWQ98320.1 hypothetical protein DKT75_04090 [Leucothrix arctica]